MKLRYLLLIILAAFCIMLVSCEEDGIPRGESTEEHTHIYSSTVVAPTCTERGYTTKTCECGDTLTVNYVEPMGHSATVWTTITSATCTEEGKKELRCSSCDLLVDEKIDAKLPHATTDTVVESTCTEKGYTKHVCKTCGHSYNDTYLPEASHEEGEPITTKNPTCKQTGEREYRCTKCDLLIRKQTLGVISCEYIAYSIEATQTEDAHTLYVCSTCGDSHTGPYISQEALAQATAKEIYNESKNALVEIVSYDKSGAGIAVGSGFFISADGYIVTNYHVIQASYSLSVTRYSDASHTTNVKIVAYNSSYDIAILKVEVTEQAYLEFSTVPVETGDAVYAIGSTLGLTDTFSSGIVSNTNRYVNGKSCIQFTAPISSGNSGGPLINSSGKVVGVVSMTVPDAQNINFAIRSTLVEMVNNNQRLDTPITVSELYEETLEENALYIIKLHIMNNHTGHTDNGYYIFEYEPQTSTSLAREYYYIYDTEEDEVYIQIDLIASKTGMKRLSITVLLDDNNDGFLEFSMYDYDYSQSTIVGVLNHVVDFKIMTTYNEDYFTNIFSDVEIKYLDTDAENNPQKMKTLLYQSYASLIVKFSNMLNSSSTGVTAEILDISLPG